MQPNDQVAGAVVGELDRIDLDATSSASVRAVDANDLRRRCLSAAVRHHPQRGVQSGSGITHLGEPDAVRPDGQRDLVVPAVGVRVGIPGRLGEAHPYHSVEHTVTEPAGVEDRHAEVGLGDVDEAVSAHLELGGIPRARRMGRASDHAELDVAHRHVAAHIEGKRHRQQVFVVVPIEFHVHEQLRTVGAQLVGDRRCRRPERPMHPGTPDERAGVEDFDPLGDGDRHPAGAGPRFEVPGVVLHRLVDGEFEHCGELSGRHDLAGAGEIDDRGDVACSIPAHCEVAVGHRRVRQHHSIVDWLGLERSGAERRDRNPYRDAAIGEDLTVVACVVSSPGVEHDHLLDRSVGRIGEPASRADRIGEQRRDACFQLGADLCEHRFGVGVHPGDRRARKDVVELLREHVLPEMVDVGIASERRSPQFGFDQEAFAPAVAELGLDLAGQGASMRFEVQLTAPHRSRCTPVDVTLDPIEHRVWRADLQRGPRVDVGQASSPLEHLAGRPTTAVAMAERHQRVGAPGVLLEVRDREVELLGGDLGVVGVDRWEVREHPGAVEALPPERAVREQVLLVPTELLGDEAVHAPGGEHLREPGRVAEHVGDPHLGAAVAELLLEVPLAEHDLTHETLARWQVHVRLDPHAADRHPLAALDPLDDLREQLGMASFDPRVVLRRRRGEHVLGVVVHQRDG